MTEPKLKIILLGDSGVGKTSIISQFINQVYEVDIPATVGCQYQPKSIDIGGQTIKLGIWDTAGQEKFRTLTRQFYRNVQGAIFVYSIDNPESLKNIDEYWIGQLQENATGTCQMILVGNKSDLRDTLDVSSLITQEHAQEIANKHSMMFVEASAKTSFNVQNAFEELARRILSDSLEQNQTQELDINHGDENAGESSLCC